MSITETIDITGIGSDLQGVGRLADGRAVFVPGAIPGERVTAAVIRDKGRFCEASLCDVLNPSEDRIVPACPHAGVCGGCQARHIRYPRTLELKRQVVTDTLTRIGGVRAPVVRPTLGCDAPDRRRNKAEYPIARQDDRTVIGAYARGSHRIVPLSDCLLQREESAGALRWFSERLDTLDCAGHLKYIVTRVNRTGAMMLILCADAPILPELRRLSPALTAALPSLQSLWLCYLNRRPAHALDGRCTRVFGEESLPETLMGLRFTISPQSFFQVNPEQTEQLYAAALEAAGIRPDCGLNVLDAYCGAGTISLSAARWADHVTGIEIVPPAIADANRNTARNGLDGKADFICADAAAAIPRLLAGGRRFDAAILDPPRSGADAALLDALASAQIPTLAYVSCNPATLARDVKRLCAREYHLDWAQPVDMFPWTGHVETVVCLSNKNAKQKDNIEIGVDAEDYYRIKDIK